MISAKNLYRPYFALIGFSLLIFLLAGCVGGTSSPSTFYLLHPMEQEQVPNTELKKSKPISILIGPIAVPAYLDRPQVVTLTSGNRLVLNEFNRWAEPLRDNFYRVLAENLFLLMDTNDIFTYERRGLIPSGIQVVIDVNRFDFTQGKN
ncbi:MAG: membrane integrity-associated transporter subunit PqiC, partial [Desulfobacteraceae bacterium]|nr:membrane integrity-associated transporter subunit PqiC [Desulfobacteraceae bacterium]